MRLNEYLVRAGLRCERRCELAASASQAVDHEDQPAMALLRYEKVPKLLQLLVRLAGRRSRVIAREPGKALWL